MSRQRQVLLGLCVVLVASLLYAYWAMPRQEKAPLQGASPQPAVAGKARPKKPAPVGQAEKTAKPSGDRLLLEALQQEPRAFPGADRDIFRFAGGGAAIVAEIDPQVVVPPPPPPPKPPPTPEEILTGMTTRITFLGFLEKKGSRTVFLSSGQEVYLVKAGERFGADKELIAREITARQLVVGWTDGPETVTVDLRENEKLQPAAADDDAAGKEPAVGVSPSAKRPRPITIAPRRLLMPQRAPQLPAEEAPPEEPVVEAAEPPAEDVSQEEPPK